MGDECEYYMRERERNDDVFYLFLQEHKLVQRYIPTEYLPLVIKKAYMMMLPFGDIIFLCLPRLTWYYY